MVKKLLYHGLMYQCLLVFIFILSVNLSAFSNILEDAEKYIEVREFDKALDSLKSFTPKNIDENARHLYLIGKIYYSLGRVSKAEEFFSDASMKDPDNAVYSSALAEAKIGLGKFTEAKKIANRVVKNDLNVIEAHIVLATIDERLGNINAAKKRFIDLIKLQPQSEIINVAYANFLDLRVNTNEGIEILIKYTKRYPNSPKALNQLGKMYALIGDKKNAIKYNSMALDIYETRGQKIYSKSIQKWLDLNIAKEIETLETEEESKDINLSSIESSISYETPRYLEPWPINEGDYAYTGSGFITNNGTHVVTNQHVIEDAKQIYVRNGLGELRSARVLMVSGTDDIAVLELEKPYNNKFSQNIPQNFRIKPGQKVLVMGYPLADILGENKPSITQGIVSKDTGMNDDPGFFQLTAKLNSGNSGGPIFTEEGNIIGIAVMKLDKTLMLQEDGTIPEDVNFGIPSTRIERLTGYSSDEIFTQDLDLEKLYEALIPSVVMVLNILDAQE
jgi:tetratricopeptide (TPR) repeat protein